MVQRGSRVTCFKLSSESQWPASIDVPVMGQGYTCIYGCQLPHFQAVTLNPGNLNQIIPTTRPSFIPQMNPCSQRGALSACHLYRTSLSRIYDFLLLKSRILLRHPLCSSIYRLSLLSLFPPAGLLHRPTPSTHTHTHAHTHTNMSQPWYARHAYATQKMISIHSVG